MKEKSSITPVLLGLPVGLLLGIGVYTFGYARGASYMTDDPAACANCHVMREQFDGWQRSSHHAVAVCNDCHAPAGFLPKYFTKALNGMNHSLAFTSGRFPENIIVTPRNHRVAEEACLKCHADVTDMVRSTRSRGDAFSCTTCHRNVGHGH